MQMCTQAFVLMAALQREASAALFDGAVQQLASRSVQARQWLHGCTAAAEDESGGGEVPSVRQVVHGACWLLLAAAAEAVQAGRQVGWGLLPACAQLPMPTRCPACAALQSLTRAGCCVLGAGCWVLGASRFGPGSLRLPALCLQVSRVVAPGSRPAVCGIQRCSACVSAPSLPACTAPLPIPAGDC